MTLYLHFINFTDLVEYDSNIALLALKQWPVLALPFAFMLDLHNLGQVVFHHVISWILVNTGCCRFWKSSRLMKPPPWKTRLWMPSFSDLTSLNSYLWNTHKQKLRHEIEFPCMAISRAKCQQVCESVVCCEQCIDDDDDGNFEEPWI